jgi:hypothetical protein
MKKPSRLLVLFLLFAVVHTEIPELLCLSDNTSNDLRLSACERHPIARCTLSETAGAAVQTMPARPSEDFDALTSEKPSILTGQDLLILCSVHRT